MKNNFFFIKKPKLAFLSLLAVFCLLTTATQAQETFTWTGAMSNDWADTLNWTQSDPGGGDDYPGQAATIDIVEITNGGTPNIASGTYTISRMLISNATGPDSGSVLTIASSGTLNVTSNTVTQVTLAGGSIVNSGTLSLLTTSTSASASLLLASAVVVPAAATEFGYSGLGNLNINIATGGANNSVAILSNAASARTTYKMLFNSATTNFTLITNPAFVTTAIRVATPVASTNFAPVIIGGTGFKLGTPMAPVRGGLIVETGRNIVTVNAGTILELNSLNGSLNHGINIANNSVTSPTFFTNNGTIKVSGETNRGGVNVGINVATAGQDIRITFVNNGVIDVNINSGAVNYGAYTAVAGSPASSTLAIATITNNGTMTFKNSSVIGGCGQAIWGSGAGQRTYTNFVNNGTVNFDGSIASTYQGFTFTNNGSVSTNSTFGGGANFTNAATGTINFTKTHATVGVDASVAATAGAVYTDGTNFLTVRMTKVSGTGTLLACDSTPTAAIVAGTLTLVSGTGDASFTFTSVNTSGNAISTVGAATTTTLSGTINTGKGDAPNLNTISSTANTFVFGSNSVLAPGGQANKGVVFFTRTLSTTLNGTLKIQVSGNGLAGVDYDKIVNSGLSLGFTISGAKLDLTGIYKPTAATSIDIITTNAGTITGTFASVIGMTPLGWAIDYTTDPSKVTLVYTPTAGTAVTWTGAVDTAWNVAGNWSPSLPTATSDVTIAAAANQPVIGSNVSINSLTIDNTASLNLGSGFNLTVQGDITNDGDLNIWNNANLLQINNNATNFGTGTTKVYRNSSALRLGDYTLWSSPVFDQKLLAFSPQTSNVSPNNIRFYDYSEANNWYATIPFPNVTPFALGGGYLIRMPTTAPVLPAAAVEYAGEFKGSLNNGDISRAVTYSGAGKGYNLVGNPYPSTINADTFIAANNSTILGSLYFWRKTNGVSGNAYAVYNAMGATAS